MNLHEMIKAKRCGRLPLLARDSSDTSPEPGCTRSNSLRACMGTAQHPVSEFLFPVLPGVAPAFGTLTAAWTFAALVLQPQVVV